MKKVIAILVLVTLYQHSFAQEDSNESYEKYRHKITRPPYGLEKVLTLVKNVASDENENLPIAQKDYLALSLREKFTYHMIHAETYSQNCDAIPPDPDLQKKIFGQLPDAFDDFSWSERQGNFFQANRDSVIALMTESIGRTNRIGLNYKMAIVDINAREMIPLLINVYNRDHKDHDILTVLMLLMKNNEYGPFMTSPSFKKLYASTNYESSYRAALTLNTANEELIIQRAKSFYDTLPKKH
ncbi:hypothetical protein HGH93_29525 [Chitinophaga polysaccharea]|uniref:hypothetical protein n=1 Tax=Chitinophaga polysaccharea TaxID=1293035 RepID=UPI0014554E61|nr:hypothetical protein [Chitinophaga polysaccharea]NLR62268.1 hypothetical protein [Chitinophaga polysaccharea]